MNPTSGRYVETVVNSNSLLVTSDADEAAVAAIVAGAPGVSLSGLVLPAADGDVFTAIALRFGNDPLATRSITIAVDGQPAIPVTFAQGANLPGFLANMRNSINARLAASGQAGAVAVAANAVGGLRLLSISSAGGSVVVSAAQQNDVAAAVAARGRQWRHRDQSLVARTAGADRQRRAAARRA